MMTTQTTTTMDASRATATLNAPSYAEITAGLAELVRSLGHSLHGGSSASDFEQHERLSEIVKRAQKALGQEEGR